MSNNTDNWLSLSECLIAVQNVLADFVNNEAKKLHSATDLATKFVFKDKWQDHIREICEALGKFGTIKSIADLQKLNEEIVDRHHCRPLSLSNIVDASELQSYWGFAKLFLPKRGYKETQSATDTDIPGLISFLKHTRKKDDPMMLLLCRFGQVRNAIVHSSSLKLTDIELGNYADTMVELMCHRSLRNEQKADEAVKTLNLLQAAIEREQIKEASLKPKNDIPLRSIGEQTYQVYMVTNVEYPNESIVADVVDKASEGKIRGDAQQIEPTDNSLQIEPTDDSQQIKLTHNSHQSEPLDDSQQIEAKKDSQQINPTDNSQPIGTSDDAQSSRTANGEQKTIAIFNVRSKVLGGNKKTIADHVKESNCSMDVTSSTKPLCDDPLKQMKLKAYRNKERMKMNAFGVENKTQQVTRPAGATDMLTLIIQGQYFKGSYKYQRHRLLVIWSEYYREHYSTRTLQIIDLQFGHSIEELDTESLTGPVLLWDCSEVNQQPQIEEFSRNISACFENSDVGINLETLRSRALVDVDIVEEDILPHASGNPEIGRGFEVTDSVPHDISTIRGQGLPTNCVEDHGVAIRQSQTTVCPSSIILSVENSDVGSSLSSQAPDSEDTLDRTSSTLAVNIAQDDRNIYLTDSGDDDDDDDGDGETCLKSKFTSRQSYGTPVVSGDTPTSEGQGQQPSDDVRVLPSDPLSSIGQCQPRDGVGGLCAMSSDHPASVGLCRLWDGATGLHAVSTVLPASIGQYQVRDGVEGLHAVQVSSQHPEPTGYLRAYFRGRHGVQPVEPIPGYLRAYFRGRHGVQPVEPIPGYLRAYFRGRHGVQPVEPIPGYLRAYFRGRHGVQPVEPIPGYLRAYFRGRHGVQPVEPIPGYLRAYFRGRHGVQPVEPIPGYLRAYFRGRHGVQPVEPIPGYLNKIQDR